MTQDLMGTILVQKQTDLLRMALSLCQDIVKARDLVQDTCLKALENCAKFISGEVTAWLKSMMTRLFIDKWRRACTVEKHCVEITDIADDKLNQVFDFAIDDKAMATVEKHDIIKQIFKKLSDRDRRVLILVAHDYTTAQIAKTFNTNVNTALSYVHRARIRARKAYLNI